ncbi:MAG: N,N-dimethylformamidase beta subunit family domain-containing protein [Actinomycetota bacterium]
MSDATPDARAKQVTGYLDRWSVRAGDRLTLRASSHSPGLASLSLVRIHCGDHTRSGPGYAESVIDLPDSAGLPPVVELVDQPLRPGSYGIVDLDGLTVRERLTLRFAVMATRPIGPQQLAAVVGDGMILEVLAEDGILRVAGGGMEQILRSAPLANRRWYRVAIDVDLTAGQLTAAVTTADTVSPGRDLTEPDAEPITVRFGARPSSLQALVLAADGVDPAAGGRFDGRLGELAMTIDDTTLRWDLSQDMDSPVMVDVSGNDRNGRLHQLPARAVTGPRWDGTEQRWRDAPEQWDAVHFHTDDLYDASWEDTATVTLPKTLASGIYAVRVETPDGDDRVPFFVRPAPGAATADIALLASSATYLAYANHRMLFEGADFIASRSRLRPEHEYVRTHPDLGRSMYERHPDGSGVMFSSRLRPVLNLRPGADGWNFTPDTDLNAFLEHHLATVGGHRPRTHDVIADEDVHVDGLDALSPYRVIVTSTHPEYWSTVMLDALAAWQRNGGRLLYVGGNGFYWRVAFSDHWPGAMELRRAEDGVRNWETGPGESYHAFGGEYGGMWRRLGRAPNEVVGIGFTAQGFDRATHYEVNPAALTGRAAWLWEGVEIDDGRIGTSGLGGGAAGQELDRYEPKLGSPRHAVVLASATDFGPDMLRTKEEFEGSVAFPTPDPHVRSDMVFFETPNGGAVFSVGSISWFGALARNGYDNDVAKITGNVIDRFLDPSPFELEPGP